MKKLSVALALCVTSFLCAQDQGTGLEFSQEKYEELPQSVPLVTRSFNSLPSSFSLKPYCPTPKSQGPQGSCVGWASAYGARTIAYAIRKGWKYNTLKINQHAFSPSFVYNQIKVNAKCQGAYIEDAMRLMNNTGAAKLSEFSYDYRTCSNVPSTYVHSAARQNKIVTYERLARWNSPYNLVKKVKKAIANKSPVVIGLFKYNSLRTSPDHVWIPNVGKKGHAMVVVGYDNYKHGGAFEVMNSWGTRFANKGFFWIKYADFQRQVKTAYVLVDKTKSIPDYNKNNNNTNTNNYYSYNKLSGEIKLRLSSGSNMPVTLSNEATRGFNVVKVSKATYSVSKAYTSGTQFRIYLKSNQRGYVYLIGYGSADKSVQKLYPFGGFSDFFSYSNSEIAIPNEDYFIEFDNKPGRDILCVLYSKEKLDINAIVRKARYGSGDFVSRIKSALNYKMFKGNKVKFNKYKIAFSASSSSSSAKVVPVFIEMNHR